MNVNNTSIFSTGVAAVCNMYRINPLNSFDTNIIYAITHNYQIINIYIICQTSSCPLAVILLSFRYSGAKKTPHYRYFDTNSRIFLGK